MILLLTFYEQLIQLSFSVSKEENTAQTGIPFIHSPLEQFTIIPWIPAQLGNFLVSFTNSSFFLVLTLGLVLLFLHFATKEGGGRLVPNTVQSIVELVYDFVLNLVNEQISGTSGKHKYFPVILVTFTFLLFCNLQGMIPYSFTVTRDRKSVV